MVHVRVNLAAALLVALGVAVCKLGVSPCIAGPNNGAVLKKNGNAETPIIDRYFGAYWQRHGVEPSRLADDEEFVRRLYLDLLGRIPRISEQRAFLDDGQADNRQPEKSQRDNRQPDKRKRLIEGLLSSLEHAQHFARVLAESMLSGADNQSAQRVQPQLAAWLFEQYRDNRPYDQWVRNLLVSRPFAPNRPLDRLELGVQAFLAANKNQPEMLASNSARLFLGINLECAQCHDHPFDRWSRKQFWELAAFFVREKNPATMQGDTGKESRPSIQIPDKNQTVTAHFLNEKANEWQANFSARENLAHWLTSAENPYFATTTVNMVWQMFFSHPLVSPREGGGDSEQLIHQALQRELAGFLVKKKFRLRDLVSAIVESDVYQRSSKVTHASQTPWRHFSRMVVRPLSAEQLFDSLTIATGQGDRSLWESTGEASGMVSQRERFLTRFRPGGLGQPERMSVLQALHLMNGEFTGRAADLQSSPVLNAIVNAPFLRKRDKVDALYRATLGRSPRRAEYAWLLRYVEQNPPGEEVAMADILWSLLNSTEFSTNH